MGSGLSAGAETARNGAAVIEYRATGAGPILVLLPSAFRGADDFNGLRPLLEQSGFRVVTPEPRGTGGSAGPMDALTLHDLAGDVAAVIVKEGGGPAIVAGHAYGNWVARTLASDRPDLVQGVVVIAASAKGPTAPALVAAIAVAADERRSREERIAALRLAFFAPASDPSPWLLGWRPEIRDAQRRAAAATPQEEYWTAGGKPILELQASEDPFLPASARSELRLELGAQVTTVLIKDASHALVAEQPHAVASALTCFAMRLAPSARFQAASCP